MLADEQSTVRNVHLDAVEHREHVVFMHRIQEGPASRSFGLQVAKLAGVPAAVLAAADHKLRELEATRGETAAPTAAPMPQADLFQEPTNAALLEALRNCDPDALTPRQALETIYQLRDLLE